MRTVRGIPLEPYAFTRYGSQYERRYPIERTLNGVLENKSGKPRRPDVKGSKKTDPFKTNGGNGGYAKKKAVSDTPNPKKPHKRPYDYSGRDVARMK